MLLVDSRKDSYLRLCNYGRSRNLTFAVSAQEITDKDDIILLENRVPAELLAGLVIRKIEE